MIKALSQAVPVLVTFNDRTIFNVSFEKNTIEKHFAIRILASYFLELQDPDEYELLRKMIMNNTTDEELTPVDAIKIILEHSQRKSVFLGVDEIRRVCATDGNKIPPFLSSQIVTAVGKLLDTFTNPNTTGFVFSLVTTLDSNLIQDFTGSGRGIDWVPLRLLSDVALQLFPSNWTNASPKASEELVAKAQLIRHCISDCGGHPRTLATLYDVLILLKYDPEWSNISYNAVYVHLINELSHRIPTELSWEIIKPTLLGDMVNLDTIISLDNRTFRDFIGDGTYDNALDHREAPKNVVPRISGFRLHHWCVAKALKDNFSLGYATTPEVFAATVIKRYMFTGNDLPMGNASGEVYERFHMGWELLMGALHTPNILILVQHYRGARFSQDLDKQPQIIKHQQLELFLLPTVGKHSWTQWCHDNPKDVEATIQSNVIRPGQGNAGFDLVVPMGDGTSILCIENRFSMQNSGNVMDQDEFKKKIEDAHAQLGDDLWKRTVFVLVAHRKLNVDPLPRTIIIGLDNMTELYGPTLYSRFSHIWRAMSDYTSMPASTATAAAASSSSSTVPKTSDSQTSETSVITAAAITAPMAASSSSSSSKKKLSIIHKPVGASLLSSSTLPKTSDSHPIEASVVTVATTAASSSTLAPKRLSIVRPST